MASPDFREYIDLTINDLQPEEIYDSSKEYAIASLPEFDPRTGTVEDAMLQAMAYVSGTVTGAINRLPNGLLEGLMRLFGFFRRESTFATGTVVLTAIDDAGLTIPAGTQLAYNEVNDETTIVHIFETATPVTIDIGDFDSTAVQIVASEAGVKPVIADGEFLTILSPIGRLLEAQFTGSLVQGETTESDLSFFNRASTFLASLSTSIATSEQATNFVLTSYPDAYRAQAYDLKRLPVFRPSVIGYDGTDAFVSIYPKIGAANTYKTIEFIYDEQQNFFTLGEILESSAPAVDNATVIRIYDSTESEYDGLHPVTVGSVTNDIIKMTFTPSGTERKFFCFVRAATTANLSSLSGLATLIDGITLVAGDLVLVKNQTTGSQNGIYVAASGSWTRIGELANSFTLDGPIYTFVDEGDTNGQKYFKTTNSGSLTINSTALTFAEETVLKFLPKVEILDTAKVDATDVPGSLTIFVSDSSGASLSAENKALISKDVSGRTIAGLSVYISDTILAGVTVNVTIGVEEGFSKLEVKQNVIDFINNALSPGAFAFAPLVRKNALISEISRIAGVSYVQTLSFQVQTASQAVAYVDGTTDDLIFNHIGVIPVATASVGTL